MGRVLVVDDEAKLGRLAAEMLELDGHVVTRVGGGRAALVELASRRFDVVLTDLKMPEVDGFSVLAAARALAEPPEVVLMTAFGTAESAVAAMKAGAADYLTKPFSMDELQLRVRRLVDRRDVEAQNASLVDRLTPSLLAVSPAMQRVIASARQVAKTGATVLLTGESGTGKSQLAKFIHFSSPRASRPLVEVHCAAMPESLLESELFGHEKGAFTGADQKRQGHLAAADTGTLFLDEIGEVTASTQVKLLRFLQEREFVSVGSTTARKVDVRVVAATNRDLEAAIASGAFREDFYYRLNVFSIRVPPLRERREEIVPLALRALSARGIPAERLSKEARDRLEQHSFPGNVRELENALERAVIISGDDEIQAEHFEGALRTARKGSAAEPAPGDLLTPGFNLDQHERTLINAALERAGGNKAQAARLLGITRRRLYSRLESLAEKLDGAE